MQCESQYRNFKYFTENISFLRIYLVTGIWLSVYEVRRCGSTSDFSSLSENLILSVTCMEYILPSFMKHLSESVHNPYGAMFEATVGINEGQMWLAWGLYKKLKDISGPGSVTSYRTEILRRRTIFMRIIEILVISFTEKNYRKIKKLIYKFLN